MSVIDEKLKRFESIIFSDVDEKVGAVIAEADQNKEAALAEHREKVTDEYFDYMQKQVKEIHADTKRRISKAELDARRELLAHRNQLADQVFSAVKAALLAFTEAADYPTYLAEHIRAAMAEAKLPACSILLREADLPLVSAADFSVSSVSADADIRLGGFILLDTENGIMIDESFDSKLEALIPYFNRVSGLGLNQQD